MTKKMVMDNKSVVMSNPDSVFFPLQDKYKGMSVIEKDADKDIWVFNNNGKIAEGSFVEVLEEIIVAIG